MCIRDRYWWWALGCLPLALRGKGADFRGPGTAGARSRLMRLPVASMPTTDLWQCCVGMQGHPSCRSRVRIFRLQISGPESTRSVPLACGFVSGTYPRAFAAANQKRSTCNRFEERMLISMHCCHYRTFLNATDHSDRKGLWP